MATAFTGLAEFSIITATVNNTATTIAHGGTVAPDFVMASPVNAAAHYVTQTQAADATNVYLIGDVQLTGTKILCIWVAGAKKTS